MSLAWAPQATCQLTLFRRLIDREKGQNMCRSQRSVRKSVCCHLPSQSSREKQLHRISPVPWSGQNHESGQGRDGDKQKAGGSPFTNPRTRQSLGACGSTTPAPVCEEDLPSPWWWSVTLPRVTREKCHGSHPTTQVRHPSQAALGNPQCSLAKFMANPIQCHEMTSFSIVRC